MFDQDINNLNDIDYEDMDDLPLSDHIEWNHSADENDLAQDPGQMYWL